MSAIKDRGPGYTQAFLGAGKRLNHSLREERKERLSSTTKHLGAAGLSALMVACSGGGGSGPGSPGGGGQAAGSVTEPINPDRVEVRSSVGEGIQVKVAVVDTGVDDKHADLEGVIAGGLNLSALKCDIFDLRNCRAPSAVADHQGHGTAVASVVGGEYAGYADNARVLDVDVQDSDSDRVMTSDIFLAAGESAAMGAEVINLSWTIDPVGDAGAFTTRTDSPVGEAIDEMVSSGSVIVNSAGNDAKNYSASEYADVTWQKTTR